MSFPPRSSASRRDCAPPLARQLLVVVAIGAVAAVLAHLGDDTAWLLPVVLIVAPLLAGWYPGEPLLAALKRRASPWTRRLTATLAPRRRAARILMPRGGRLLAAALAGRAPPS